MRRWINTIIAIIAIIARDVSDAQDLYDTEVDNVLLLDNESFDKHVNCSCRYSVVEFYSSQCGHCRDFAPHYQALSNGLRDVSCSLVVAAVDCFRYPETCHQQKINATPTIKLFAPFNETSPVLLEDLNSQPVKVDEIIANISQKMDISKASRCNCSCQGEIDKTAVLKEHAQSLLGLQLKLLLSPFCGVKFNIEKTQKPTHLLTVTHNAQNSVLLVRNTSNATEHVKSMMTLADTKMGARVSLSDVRAECNIQPIIGQNEQSLSSAERKAVMQNRNTSQLYCEDLESAVFYFVTREANLQWPFDATHNDTMFKVLKAILLYFPKKCACVDADELLIELASNGLANIANNESAYFNDFNPSWVNCLGSEDQFRGYTCGLWTLIHFLSIGSKVPDECATKETEMMEVVRSWIENFFSCKECRDNFMNETSDWQEQKCEPGLYFWEIHNKVNTRLHGDSTEDPTHIKVQFPTKTDCPRCRNAQGVFVRANVATFLRGFYSLDNVDYYKTTNQCT